MNKVEIVGRLTRDPELYAGNNTVAKFGVAVQRKFKDKDGNYGADFINCVAFGKTADFISNYFHKGSQIGLTGRVQTGSYNNKDGQKVYTTDIAVEEVEFVGSKGDNGGSSAPKASRKADDDGFLNIPDSVDDLPFVQ